jgi:hypothetical protein
MVFIRNQPGYNLEPFFTSPTAPRPHPSSPSPHSARQSFAELASPSWGCRLLTRATRQRDPALVPLPGALKYLPRAPAGDPRPGPRSRPQHGIPGSPPQSSAEVPSLLALHPVCCLHKGRNRRPRKLSQAQKYLHDFSHQELRNTLFRNLDWRL